MSRHFFPFLRPIALATVLSLSGLTTQAQTAPSVQTARAIRIEAQPLAQALNELARQTGLELIVQTGLVADKTAPAVSGQLTPQQALDRLLTGNGLQANIDGGTVVIKAGGAASSQALPEVRVTGITRRETATGPVSGYSAKRSATATKTDTPLIETPQTIAVIGADQVRQQGSQSVSEALRYTAGIGVGVDTTQDNIILRGFSLTGGGGSIYLDGSKLPLGGFNGRLEPYGLERLEVLKGASSVLYGFVQPGGMVNLVTKRPNPGMTQELNVSYGSQDRKQVSADLGGALNDSGTWSYRLTGLYRQSDTFQDFAPDDRLYLAPAIKWQPNSRTSLTLLAQYQESKSVAFNQLPIDTLTGANPNGKLPRSRYTGEPGDFYKPAMYSFGYLFEQSFTDDLKLRHSLRYYRATYDMQDSHGGGGATYVADGLFRNIRRQFYVRSDDSRVTSSDTSLQYKFNTAQIQHDLIGGLDYARQEFIGDRARYALGNLDIYNPVYGASTPGAFSNTQHWRDSSPMLGAYLQDQIKFDKRWVWLVGGRRDWWHYDSTDYTETQKTTASTGRTGLVYLADNGLAPFVSFSQSFEPNFDRDRLGNRYTPTTGEQYEVGVRYQPTDSDLLVSASIYQLTQKDVLTTDPVDSNYSVQTGAIRSRGLEIEARGRVTRNLSLVASYAYTDARVTHSNTPAEIGQRQAMSPFNQASAWADYRFGVFGLPDLTVGAGVRYVGSTDVTPEFTVFDASVSYDAGKWRYALNINNLTDKHYIDLCSFNCTWGRPLDVVATVSYRW